MIMLTFLLQCLKLVVTFQSAVQGDHTIKHYYYPVRYYNPIKHDYHLLNTHAYHIFMSSSHVKKYFCDVTIRVWGGGGG